MPPSPLISRALRAHHSASRPCAALAVALGLAALGPLLLGCQDATQITLSIHTDIACDDLQDVGISVGPADTVEAALAAATTVSCDPASGRIGSLVVVPSGDDPAPVGIRVVAGVGAPFDTCVPPDYTQSDPGAGCVVARRALRFVDHTPLELPISLSRSCIGHPCGPESTCVEGVCSYWWISDGEDCPQGRCTGAQLSPCEAERSCEGDTNDDGLIDGLDLNIVLSAHGSQCGQPRFDPQADVVANLAVDDGDVQLVVILFNCSCDDLCGCTREHPCPGDVDGNGEVDSRDLALVQQALGTQCGEPGYLFSADFDSGNTVDGGDFLTVQAAYGNTCGPG